MLPRHLKHHFILGLGLIPALAIVCVLSQNGAAGAQTPAPAPTFSGKVVSIADGDTITVLRGRGQIRVRLHGIDCPERRQAFGTRARQFTGELAAGKTVTVQVRDTDRYGRMVAEVILPDGRNLSHELVKAGLAWWYRRYAPEDRVLERLEREARDAERGLSCDKEPVASWEWRRLPTRSTTSIVRDPRRRSPLSGRGPIR